MTTKVSLSLLTLFALIGDFDRAEAQTQADMNATACEESRQAEAELNSVLSQVLEAQAADTNFTDAFRDAQQAWLAFRDAHIRSVYPYPSPRAYGSVHPMCQCYLRADFTRQRIKELRSLWIDGTEEGDVCVGSGVVSSAPPNIRTLKK